MGKDFQENEIDGLTFVSHQMDPLELYPMVPRILKLLAPVLPHISAIGGGLNAKAIERLFAQDAGKLAPIIAAIGEGLGAKENANLPLELLKRTVVMLPDPDPDDEDAKPKRQSLVTAKEINAVFRGRFVTMLKAMWFALGVNFDDFFAGSSGSENPSKE